MDYEKIISRQAAKIEQLTKLLEQALLRIAELESQLNQNSRNSSKPPSSDLYNKKSGLPRKKGKRGGQKGHKGNTLKMSDKVDHLEQCAPIRCSCGKRLLRQPMQLQARRQVFDIPDPKLFVTEYQQLSCHCPACGRLNKGEFPSAVQAPVQYGVGVKALVSLLHVKCQLSYQNISQLFLDLFGQPINGATMQQAMQNSYDRLGPIEQQLKDQLLLSAVLHADETGVKIDTRRAWMHVLSNDRLTYLYVDNSRGKSAIKAAINRLFDYTGTVIHDCFSSYWGLTKAQHGLCGPHLLRELTALIEQDSPWAGQMHALLLDLYRNKLSGKSFSTRHQAWREYDKICQQADQYEPPPQKSLRGKPKKSKGRNLAERLTKYKTEVLRFALQSQVPFSNNQAERDLRPVKGKQKVAGCFRTIEGAQRYARLQSVFSSWTKQGQSIFKELKAILNGHHFDFAQLTT